MRCGYYALGFRLKTSDVNDTSNPPPPSPPLFLHWVLQAGAGDVNKAIIVSIRTYALLKAIVEYLAYNLHIFEAKLLICRGAE